MPYCHHIAVTFTAVDDEHDDDEDTEDPSDDDQLQSETPTAVPAAVWLRVEQSSVLESTGTTTSVLLLGSTTHLQQISAPSPAPVLRARHAVMF